MRIAIYHNTPPGGARRAVHEMGRGLAARGPTRWEFRVTTRDPEDGFLPLAPHCVGTRTWSLRHVSPPARWVPLLSPYLALGALLRNLRQVKGSSHRAAQTIDEMGFDLALVHDCEVAENPYLLRYLETPHAFYCHHGGGRLVPPHPTPQARLRGLEGLKSRYYGPAGWLSRAVQERVARVNARSAQRVWTNSCFARECLYVLYGVDSTVVPLGVDTATFRPLGLPRERFILAVGALHPLKGYAFPLRGVAAIPEPVRPPLIIAAADAYPSHAGQLERLAQQLGVSYQVQRIWDDEKLARLYNRAMALAFTPVMEPFGLAPLEAMACGTPVVAVREGGVRESVVDGVTGLLVDRDPARFASALQRLIQDDALRRRLGEAGVAHVRTRWRWERTVDEVERHMREILSGQAR
jgi:glycosyltransferase involved in cell wall biosynthesis